MFWAFLLFLVLRTDFPKKQAKRLIKASGVCATTCAKTPALDYKVFQLARIFNGCVTHAGIKSKVCELLLSFSHALWAVLQLL